MRIATVAPLVEAVPPPLYGGTERVVSVLTEELVRRGHEITLFASGDSRTRAHLVPCSERGLRLDPDVRNYVATTMLEPGEVYGRADELDLIHNHNDYLAFPFARLTRTPTLTTTHGRLDIAEVRRLYGAFPEQRLISISDAQRRPLPDANWVATVYNGIELSQFTYCADPEQYLLYLARINPEKRPDRAIEIARDAGMLLVMAAKVDPVDQAYYESAIAPMIRDCPLVEYVGEVGPAERARLMGGACAYLFPIDWPEPFGLTMVEAMATGTPVIAYRAGSVPEVVVDGVTGFICSTLTEMVAAIPRVRELDRRACRAHVEQHLTGAVMADGYERAYARLLDDVRSAAPSANGRGVVNSHPNRLARS